MSTLTADETLRALLSQVKDVTQIRDTAGEVLGYFTPRAKVYQRAAELFDPAEIKRRKEAEHGQGVSTEELLRRLQTLENQG